MGYDPLEVNPEDMVRFAKERPQVYDNERVYSLNEFDNNGVHTSPRAIFLFLIMFSIVKY